MAEPTEKPPGAFSESADEHADAEIAHLDPLRATYREAIIESPAIRRSLEHFDTAMLCIDMQYLDAAPHHGVFADAVKSGISPESQRYYFDRLDNVVLPNVRRLQDAFRQHRLEVIHTRIQSLTADGRDRGPQHKRLDLHAPPGSREADFIESVAPVGDEIVINKTASGVFNSTNLAYVLRNLEITGLVVVGVYTNECVSTAIRDACDLGFLVTLISDGCATVTPELQAATITAMKDRYARVVTTDEMLDVISTLAEAPHG